MKRSPLNSRSPKGALIAKCEALCKQILLVMHGARCRFCGETYDLTLFHIMPKSIYPEVRLLFLNLLISCMKCHRIWEDHLPGHIEIERQIIEIIGTVDYESHILGQREALPKVSMYHLHQAHEQLKRQLRFLQRERSSGRRSFGGPLA